MMFYDHHDIARLSGISHDRITQLAWRYQPPHVGRLETRGRGKLYDREGLMRWLRILQKHTRNYDRLTRQREREGEPTLLDIVFPRSARTGEAERVHTPGREGIKT